MDINDLLDIIKHGENERIEFKRSISKDIANQVVAMANAVGGHILIGVDDDGSIVGTDTKKANDRLTNSLQSIMPSPEVTVSTVEIGGQDLLIIEVQPSEALLSIGGVAYIRIGAGIRPLSIQEVLTLSIELGTFEWDKVPILPIDDARGEYIDWFFKRLEETRGRSIDDDARNRYLRSAGAVKGDQLTNAGALFFTNADETVSQSRLRLIYMSNGEPEASKEFHGPIWRMVDDALTDLRREYGGRDLVVGVRRLRVGDIPVKVLREALINAVAHRSYAIQADVRVFVHPDHVEIRNPGGLMPGVDLEDPEHIPRNPSLCNLLFDAGLIERYGYGIKMMRSTLDEHEDIKLDIQTRPGIFKLIISIDIEPLLDETDRRIVEILFEPKSSGELAKSLGVSKPTILSRVDKLEALGLVKQVGNGPATKYVVRG